MAIDKNIVIKEAQKYVSKGQFDKAIAEWKKLLKETPDDPNIYNTIGDLCLKKDSKADAVDAYSKAAESLAADGFTSKAIALYKKVLNINPQKIEAHHALGDLNAEKGLIGAALESYKIVADHFSHQNDMGKALGIYQKMADLNPANVTFRIKLGEMYAKDGMQAEAVKAYLAAADSQISKNAFQDARQLFEKVLSLDPSNKEVYHKAGLVYFKERKFSEACKALKSAFEDDPANKELAEIYLESLFKAEKHAEAEEVLITLVTADASRTDLREKLYNLYLSEKEYDKALREASAIAQVKEKVDDLQAAEDIFKSFVTKNPDFAPGREKLAEFYVSNYQPDDAAQEFLRAAELYQEAGDETQYKALLYRALETAPGMPEAKKRLEELEVSTPILSQPEQISPTGASTPIPSQSEQASSTVVSTPIPPQPEQIVTVRETPTMASPTSPPVSEEDLTINEAFTEADVLIKYGLPAKAAEQLEGLVTQYPENIRVRIRLRDLYRDQGNIEKTINHMIHLSDIYAKRNKADLADTELQTARELAPNNPLVLNRFGITPTTPGTSSIYPPEIQLDHLDIAPMANPIPSSTFEETPPLLEPVAASDDSLIFKKVDAEISPADTGMPTDINHKPDHEPLDGIIPDETGLSLQAGLVDEAASSGDKPFGEPLDEEVQPLEEASSIEVDLSEIWAEAEFYYQQGLFDEARKHYAKIIELTPSDRRAIDRLAEISREEDETREFTRLAEAVESLEDGFAPETSDSALATSASDEEAVRRLMKEIESINIEQKRTSLPQKSIAPEIPRLTKILEDEVNNKLKPATPSNKVTAPQTQKSQATKPEKARFDQELQPTSSPQSNISPKNEPVQSAEINNNFAPAKESTDEEYFDLGAELQKEVSSSLKAQKRKSNDYFDLAAELREDMNTMLPATHPPVLPEEQSLDDIFEEFKKGADQQSTKEETDTHYNLGVAYKEMGLLDDAIAEFIMTPKGEPWFIESRYMLGLCYMEKGDFEKAITELRNALSYSTIQKIADQDRIGIEYDLGLAYQGIGNFKAATTEFQKVADVNPNYRDASAKLKELRQGEFISLEQLKNDIEKEISAKFLQEGERIERQEKSRKSDKVRH
ncbi:MAG TPA: tetratricopeptide repeat protein [Nitrospirota bacterium]|nr:tetratricopeptide repeat protein [Nitrospirota bacterium]